jgi:hypothetical protein
LQLVGLHVDCGELRTHPLDAHSHVEHLASSHSDQAQLHRQRVREALGIALRNARPTLGSHVDFDDAAGLQRPHCFADAGAADAELSRQVSFGAHHLARLKPTIEQGFGQLRDDFVRGP